MDDKTKPGECEAMLSGMPTCTEGIWTEEFPLFEKVIVSFRTTKPNPFTMYWLVRTMPGAPPGWAAAVETNGMRRSKTTPSGRNLLINGFPSPSEYVF